MGIHCNADAEGKEDANPVPVSKEKAGTASSSIRQVRQKDRKTVVRFAR